MNKVPARTNDADCSGPFCIEDHDHRLSLYEGPLPVLTDDEVALLDWEGPLRPEYSEIDLEALDEVERFYVPMTESEHEALDATRDADNSPEYDDR